MNKKTKQPQPRLNPVIIAALRSTDPREHHREPQAQKDELVQYILDAFENPDAWPVRDDDRIWVLKNVWKRARKIRDTERALVAAK
jgi:hypothetical protein